jgi:hypothetical protein
LIEAGRPYESKRHEASPGLFTSFKLRGAQCCDGAVLASADACVGRPERKRGLLTTARPINFRIRGTGSNWYGRESRIDTPVDTGFDTFG